MYQTVNVHRLYNCSNLACMLLYWPAVLMAQNIVQQKHSPITNPV